MKTNKKIYLNIKNVYGLNKPSSYKLCKFLGLNPNEDTAKLTAGDLDLLDYYIEQDYLTGALLKYEKINAIKKLIILKNYRGKRIRRGYPANGQRTRSNAKTAKKLNKKKCLKI